MSHKCTPLPPWTPWIPRWAWHEITSQMACDISCRALEWMPLKRVVYTRGTWSGLHFDGCKTQYGFQLKRSWHVQWSETTSCWFSLGNWVNFCPWLSMLFYTTVVGGQEVQKENTINSLIISPVSQTSHFIWFCACHLGAELYKKKKASIRVRRAFWNIKK